MPQASSPIGVFDSGVGGLSVLRALLAAMPHERFVYLADSANAPYGERGDAFVAAGLLALPPSEQSTSPECPEPVQLLTTGPVAMMQAAAQRWLNLPARLCQSVPVR